MANWNRNTNDNTSTETRYEQGIFRGKDYGSQASAVEASADQRTNKDIKQLLAVLEISGATKAVIAKAEQALYTYHLETIENSIAERQAKPAKTTRVRLR